MSEMGHLTCRERRPRRTLGRTSHKFFITVVLAKQVWGGEGRTSADGQRVTMTPLGEPCLRRWCLKTDLCQNSCA